MVSISQALLRIYLFSTLEVIQILNSRIVIPWQPRIYECMQVEVITKSQNSIFSATQSRRSDTFNSSFSSRTTAGTLSPFTNFVRCVFHSNNIKIVLGTML